MLSGRNATTVAGGAVLAASEIIDDLARGLAADSHRPSAYNGITAAREMTREVGQDQERCHERALLPCEHSEAFETG